MLKMDKIRDQKMQIRHDANMRWMQKLIMWDLKLEKLRARKGNCDYLWKRMVEIFNI